MEREFQRLFTEMPIGAVLLSWEYDIRAANEAFESFVGYSSSELEGRSIFELVDVHDSQGLIQELRCLHEGERKFVGVATRYERKDGTLVWGYPIWMHHPLQVGGQSRDALLVLVVDITERRRMEMQMRHSEQMDSLGMLAGSVAHEFNNVLTIIKAFVELLEADSEAPDRVNESIQRIRIATERGETMTRQLLDFGRVEGPESEAVDINEIVKQAADMFAWVLPPTVKVNLSLEETLPKVHTNRGRLQRLLMDRVLGARDAMKGEGLLTLQTLHTSSDAVDFPTFDPIEAGEYVVMRILDTGEGVPADSIPELLEPFVTFESTVARSASNMHAVHGVFAHEEGFVCIESRRQGGTRFELYLPARHD